MANTLQPSEIIVTKPMYNFAVSALGKCNRCTEKLSVFNQLGFPQPDIESQVNEWRPRLEGIIAQYNEQLERQHG